MRGDIRTLALLACIVLIPAAALAQAVIAGTVRDSSGAVLPGVTVEAASPALVDVQSARREITLNNEVLRSIPTVRSYNALVVVVPGVVTNLNDVATGTATTQFPIHGGRNNEGRMTIDGLNIGKPRGGNQPPGYIGRHRQRPGGHVHDVRRPWGIGDRRAGDERRAEDRRQHISGAVFFSGTGENLQSDNFTRSCVAGLAAPTPLSKVYDLNGAVGGRSRGIASGTSSTRARRAAREGSRTCSTTRMPATRRSGSTSPDLSRPAFSDRTWENVSGRITWQATPRNKIGGFWDEQWICRKCEGMTQGITDPPRVAPRRSASADAAAARAAGHLVVAGHEPAAARCRLRRHYYGWGNFERIPNPTRDLIRVTEQCAPAAPPTATSRAWSTARRTGATTARLVLWRRPPPTSPARTA